MNDSADPNVGASTSGALSAYLAPVLERRDIVLDASQVAALGRLERLHDEFAEFVRARRSLLRRWFNPPIPPRGPPPPRGARARSEVRRPPLRVAHAGNLRGPGPESVTPPFIAAQSHRQNAGRQARTATRDPQWFWRRRRGFPLPSRKACRIIHVRMRGVGAKGEQHSAVLWITSENRTI